MAQISLTNQFKIASEAVLRIRTRIDLALPRSETVLGIRIRIRIKAQGNWPKLTNKIWFPAFQKDFSTYLTVFYEILHLWSSIFFFAKFNFLWRQTRIRIWIRIGLAPWIRIPIELTALKPMRIHNTGPMYGIAKLWFHFRNHLQKEGILKFKKRAWHDEESGAWAGGSEQEPGEERAHAGEDEGVAPPLSITQHQLQVLVLTTNKRTGIAKKFNKFSCSPAYRRVGAAGGRKTFKNFWAWYTKGCGSASL